MDEDFFRDLGFIEETYRNGTFINAFEPYLNKALDIVVAAVKRRAPVATGAYRRGIVKKIVKTATSITGLVTIEDEAAKYAYFIENGRAPGKFPPWGLGTGLFKWVKLKVNLAEYRASGKTPRNTKSRDKMILGIAFLIARKIAKRGTYGKYHTGEFAPLPKPFTLGWAESENEVAGIIDYGIDIAMAGMAA